MNQILPKEARVSREILKESLEGPLNLSEVFGNTNPVELEIGIGKGYFIQYEATANPERNYIGIEVSRKYLNMSKERVEKRPIPNARFICGEAHAFLEENLQPETLAAVHIYFPDPWPKKRHHKRRLFSPEFIVLVHSRLIQGGKLLIATDHAGYWEHICEVLAGQTLLERCTELPKPAPGTGGLTNYEIKYTVEGREIFRTGYQKP